MSQGIPSIDRLAEQIDRQGVVVYDITKMPVYGESFVIPYAMLTITCSGWTRVDFDFEEVIYRENDFSAFRPDHVFTPVSTSEDYRAMLFIMSKRFYNVLTDMFPDNYRFVQYYNRNYHLKPNQVKGMICCFQLLSALCSLGHPDRFKLVASQVDVVAHMMEVYASSNGFVLETKSGLDLLVQRFHVLVSKNYHKNREVKFYADKLCLSPKYFGTLIHKAMGVSAGQVITRYVMVQAKHLLRHHRNLTIQQISDKLGFSDQTSFARYFKSHSGQTPQEYREGK
ncbi:MAG: helix-turn-helix domain-containing protein [Bacteroidaceae bacterium]|nr:helix-turn-helix domain-containing protein [Bacteroidaceae bacterium]